MLQNFSYEGSLVRTITDENNEVWFAGVDVCNVLGYSDSYAAIEELDEDEKKLDRLEVGSGQRRRTWTVNEFGLYSLILSSKKPEVKKIKRWVTHEVLPSIRKAGLYSTEEAQQRESDLQQITILLNEKKQALRIRNSDVKELKREIKELEKQREEYITSYRQAKIKFPKLASKNINTIIAEELSHE